MKELQHILSTKDFPYEMIEELSSLADKIAHISQIKKGILFLKSVLIDKRMMLYFSQPSTRTFLSFSSACQLLGMDVNEIRDPSISSEVKGEHYLDSMRTFGSYVDGIILRTLEKGYAKSVANYFDEINLSIPIINAGSGKDEHPTQALLDIYTLQKGLRNRGGVENKIIAFMGDLKRGRTVRSLCYLLSLYPNINIVFIAPEVFMISSDITDFLDAKGVKYSKIHDLNEVIGEIDALYVTRIQDEHDIDGESKKIDMNSFCINQKNLSKLKKDSIILHPFPRRLEIDFSVDIDPRAIYWQQQKNGMWIRAAVLVSIFKRTGIIYDY